jgi:hypothetical protein
MLVDWDKRNVKFQRHEELFWGKDYEDMNDWVE